MYILIDYNDAVVRCISDSCEEVANGYLMNGIIYPYIGLEKVSVDTIPTEVCINEYKYNKSSNTFTHVYDETTYNAMPKNVTIPFKTASVGVKGVLPIMSSYDENANYIYNGDSWSEYTGVSIDEVSQKLGLSTTPIFTASNITDVSVSSNNAIISGNGTYIVATSNAKGIYYSTDGKTWTASNNTSDSFKCVAYSNGTFIAGSSSAGIYYSTDKGATWTQSNITSGAFNCVFYKNGLWVAANASTGLYYSISGTTWTQSDVTNIGFNNVYNNGSIWVACSIDNGIYYSTGGTAWTQSAITSGTFIEVHYYNGTWIGVNSEKYVAYSLNGMVWGYSPTTELVDYTDIVNYDGIYIGRGEDDLYYLNSKSTEWSSVGLGNNSWYIYADKYTWIIASNNAEGIKYFDCTINEYGYPGSKYVQRMLENGNYEYEISIGAEGFVEETDGNGRIWTQSNITSGTFYTVYYGNNLWIAVSNSNKGIYYSTDAISWTQSNLTSGFFHSVYYGNNIWVAGSNGGYGLYYSTDGKTWTKSNITDGTFQSVYYDNNIWVAGSNGTSNKGIYYSTNGKSWTKSNITDGSFYTVYYANNIWIAGGYGKGLYYSTDGKTWTQSNITSDRFYSLYYGNNILVAGSGSSNGIYYSECSDYIPLEFATSIPDISGDDAVIASPIYSEDPEISLAQRDDFANIYRVSTEDGSVKVYATENNTNPLKIKLKTIPAKQLEGKLTRSIITTEPTGLELEDTGEAQALINPGAGTGDMKYSMDGVNFSDIIPTASAIGNYNIFYYSDDTLTSRRSYIKMVTSKIKFNSARLPSAYQEVEYLQSSGTQYINTDYIIQSSSARVDMKVQPISIPSEGYILGAISGSWQTNNVGRFVVGIYNNKWYAETDNSGFYNGSASTASAVDISFESSGGYRSLSVGNDTSMESNNGVLSTAKLFIFARNDASNNTANFYISSKVFYCTIYDNNTKVRDLVPCYRKSDNVAGLYDLVNNVFYTNAGSGTFAVGPDVVI